MKNKIHIVFLIVSLSFLSMVGLKLGSVDTSYKSIMDAILNYNASNDLHFVLLELRLPRILIVVLAGGTLALSGYLMQALINNPLADPYFLGASSGAGLGISLVYSGIIIYSSLYVTIFAFLGALTVTLMAVALAYRQKQIDPVRLLLAGLALSSLMVALTGLILFKANTSETIKNVLFWTIGGVEQIGYSQIPIGLIVLVIAILLFSWLQKHLNLLILGENQAKALGLNLNLIRWILLLGSSFLTGLAVSVAGPIGFVGLIIPHFTRNLYGITNKYLALFTVLWGSLFLLACEVLGKLLFPPLGIPLGIFASFIGIPFFIYLISRKRLSL